MNNDELKLKFNNFRQGDNSAFVDIYNDIKTPVYTVAYRIVRNVETAEDITQEVFIKLFSSPPEKSVKNIRAWIFKTTYNLSVDFYRKNKTCPFENEEGVTESFTNEADERLDLEAALLKLTQIEVQILTLHLNAGLTFNEISHIVSLSLPTVYRKYKKALLILKDRLNGGTL